MCVHPNSKTVTRQAEERARQADATVCDLLLQLAEARERAAPTPHSNAALAAQLAQLSGALQVASERAEDAERRAR